MRKEYENDEASAPISFHAPSSGLNASALNWTNSTTSTITTTILLPHHTRRSSFGGHSASPGAGGARTSRCVQ